MADEKNAPKKDEKIQNLPQKKVAKDDAERVKGGAVTTDKHLS